MVVRIAHPGDAHGHQLVAGRPRDAGGRLRCRGEWRVIAVLYWQSLQDELNSYDPGLMKGGWPYAERWNTDIACVMFLSGFSNPKKSVDAVLDEYAAFYFGPGAATVRQLLELLDDSNKDPRRKQKIREAQAKLEGSLPYWVRRDWRWAEIVSACLFKAK